MIASEFAQRLGVPVSKIRYYDRLGLGRRNAAKKTTIEILSRMTRWNTAMR